MVKDVYKRQVIGRINGSLKQRFATHYKSFMNSSGKELHSITETNTPFVSTSAGSEDLHLSSVIVSAAANAGIPVTTPVILADDFDGTARSVTAPTIGADEFLSTYATDVFIQNDTITGEHYITGKDIWIGENVTDTEPQGPVVLLDGARLILDADNKVHVGNGLKISQQAIFIIKKK